MRDDQGRFFKDRARFRGGGDDGLEAVPVDLQDVPIERLIFLPERLQGHHVLGEAVYLDVVAVDERGQVGKFVLAREHRRFPDVPFLLLRIRHQAIDALPLAVQTRRERHADRLGQSGTQRPGGRLHPGQGAPVGMALQAGMELP